MQFPAARGFETVGADLSDFFSPVSRCRRPSWTFLWERYLLLATFYGIRIIWERDAGILDKLLVPLLRGPR
jgi:hypothetical protein